MRTRLSTRRRLPGIDHNYLVILEAMVDSGEIPGDGALRQVVVAHDPWCGIHQGGRCDCQPVVKVSPVILLEAT